MAVVGREHEFHEKTQEWRRAMMKAGRSKSGRREGDWMGLVFCRNFNGNSDYENVNEVEIYCEY